MSVRGYRVACGEGVDGAWDVWTYHSIRIHMRVSACQQCACAVFQACERLAYKFSIFKISKKIPLQTPKSGTTHTTNIKAEERKHPRWLVGSNKGGGMASSTQPGKPRNLAFQMNNLNINKENKVNQVEVLFCHVC
jgi:hypothetical protein